MNAKKKFTKKNILIVLGVCFFYLAFSLLNYYYSKNNGQLGLGGIISFGGGNDSFFYWNQALDYYHNPKTTLIETSIYVPLVANIVKVVNILDPLVIKFFNFFGFILSIGIIIKINQLVGINDLKIRNRFSILYLLLYPSLIFMVTIGIYRDIWILVFQLLSSLWYLKFFKTKKIFCLLLGLLSNYILAEFRGYAGLAMLVGFFTIVVIKFVSHKRIKQISTVMIMVFVLWYTFFKDFQFPIVNMSLTDALGYRTETIELYSGGSTIGIRLDQSNVILFLVNYVYSFLSNFVGPLFNQWNSGATLITGIVEATPMLFMILMIIKKRVKLSQDSLYLLIFNIIWIGTIAISNDNLGTATRLRLFTYLSVVIVFLQVIYSDRSKQFSSSKTNDGKDFN